ncbi:MAG: hypothetical protein ACOX7N_09950 [Lawsonibacter sp.]|jgi:hypothetical protein
MKGSSSDFICRWKYKGLSPALWKVSAWRGGAQGGEGLTINSESLLCVLAALAEKEAEEKFPWDTPLIFRLYTL